MVDDTPETDPEANEGRSTLRRPVKLKARVRDQKMSRFEVSVLDLSLTGFRGDTAFTLRPGTVIWINLPGLSGLEAEIAWQRGAEFGAQFRTPLYPAVYDHIVTLSLQP